MSIPTPSSSRTVAVLGNGVVGIALAKGFVANGLRVVFGTRDVQGDKTRAALAAVPGATAAGFAEAAAAGDFAVVALPLDAIEPALLAAGEGALAGKLVIDASNPIEWSTGAPRLVIGFDDSLGELVQRLLPRSKVVKAFNTVGYALMVNPRIADGIPDMLIAGNDEGAKEEVARLLHSFGWREPVDLGDIAASRWLEPITMAWLAYALRNDSWTHAFSIVGKKR